MPGGVASQRGPSVEQVSEEIVTACCHICCHSNAIVASTLHCRGKNGCSKKIGQTNQKMIHFVPNIYVSGKISAPRPGTQTVMIFGTAKKSENYLKQRDFRICGFLCFFCGFFAGFCGFSP